MARRKRKDDTPDWTPPEFDEVAYMRREIESAQVALVTIGWSAVGALIAWLLYTYVHWVAGFLAGMGAFAVLYVLLPTLGLPIDKFKRRDWLGHASIYFFCWLAFFILILNPPFGDQTPPLVQFMAAGTYAMTNGSDPAVGALYCVPMAAGAIVHVSAGTNNTIYVLFRATDNVGVDRVTVTLNDQPATPTFVEGRTDACSSSPANSTYLPGTYALKIPITGSNFAIKVTAVDTSGHSATGAATVQTG